MFKLKRAHNVLMNKKGGIRSANMASTPVHEAIIANERMRMVFASSPPKRGVKKKPMPKTYDEILEAILKRKKMLARRKPVVAKKRRIIR